MKTEGDSIKFKINSTNIYKKKKGMHINKRYMTMTFYKLLYTIIYKIK